jgi:protein-L-isoaspartate(D-aspartate) O-methyltransferase
LVPAGKGYLAYADADVEYAPGRWLLRPRDVGKLLQHLRPREGDKALAIAAPYAAAVLETDGRVGHPPGRRRPDRPSGANYDVIICEGAVPRLRPAGPRPWPRAAAWR